MVYSLESRLAKRIANQQVSRQITILPQEEEKNYDAYRRKVISVCVCVSVFLKIYWACQEVAAV